MQLNRIQFSAIVNDRIEQNSIELNTIVQNEIYLNQVQQKKIQNLFENDKKFSSLIFLCNYFNFFTPTKYRNIEYEKKNFMNSFYIVVGGKSLNVVSISQSCSFTERWRQLVLIYRSSSITLIDFTYITIFSLHVAHDDDNQYFF